MNQDQYRSTSEISAEDPAEIQEHIARTRADLDETLDALGNQLSPQRMWSDTVSYVRSNSEGGREFFANFAESVRRNPVPFAMIGVGMAWLIGASRRGYAKSPYAGDPLEREKSEIRDSVSAAARDVAEREGITPEDHEARKRAPGSTLPRGL